MTDVTKTVLAALNAQDVDAFLGCYAEAARIESDDGEVLAEGHDAIRRRYESLFERYPNFNVRGLRCIEAGSYVVQEEEVVGRGPRPERHIAIYRIQGGLIAHERLLREAAH